MLHIFIVSLQQDVEKRETISKTLKDFGLKFSFVDAIYGKDLPDSTLNSFRKKSTGKIINRGFSATPGEIGCTLSHLKAYQEIIDRGLEWACILEDDAILDERFKTFIEEFDDSCLDLNNLYLLGGQNGLANNQVVKSFKNIKNIGGEKFSKTIRSEDFIYRTCCYLISSSLAKSLINLSNNHYILADDWKYLVREHIINEIYLADFVDHPIDLSGSNLQKERELASLNKYLNNSFYLRAKKAIRWRIRLGLLRSYRYIEKKECL